MLVYGRPAAPLNCFPALVMGLRAWTERYPSFADWSVVSAGDLPAGPAGASSKWRCARLARFMQRFDELAPVAGVLR